MRSIKQLGTTLVSVAVGLLGTLVVAVALHRGWLDPIESIFVDLRHKTFQTIKDSDQVCIVGIDDQSLQAMGQWPWPRTMVGSIIELLGQLDSGPVLVDFTYTRPAETATLGDAPPQDHVDADVSLAEAINDHRNVLLAFYFGDYARGDRVRWPYAVSELAKRLELTPEQLADVTHLSVTALRDNYNTLRRQACQARAMMVLADQPELSKGAFLQKLLGREWLRDTDLRRECSQAYDYARAMLILQKKAGFVAKDDVRGSATSLAARDIRNDTLQPPIAPFSEACRDAGYVVYDQIDVDGRLRKVSLLARNQDMIYRQLAFATAGYAIYPGGQKIELGKHQITIRPKEGAADEHTVIPLTDDNRLIVNWCYQRAEGSRWPDHWSRSFKNILPAAKLLDVALAQQQLTANTKTLQTSVETAIRQYLTENHYRRYVSLREHLTWIDQALAGEVDANSPPPTSQPTSTTTAESALPQTLDERLKQDREQTQKAIDEIVTEMKDQLSWLAKDLEDATAEEKLQPKNREILSLYRNIFQSEQVQAGITRLGEQIEAQLAVLRPMIEGKVILFGLTATTLADAVSAPPFRERCPGVIVLANIVNQIIQKQFLSEPPMNTNLLLILVMGMIVSVVTTQRPGIQGIVWLILLLAAYLAFSFAWIFGEWHIICNVAGPLLAMCLSWALITLHYQITEGRSKRIFAMRLGQYTSASLVKRIVESPTSDVLEPQAREVSCYFSDLQGFTSISEHFQPSQIVHILNIYLEHMSEVLDKHEGFINKFEGDGIFAFFNPPLNPQPKHARLACLAAIDSQKYLPHVQQHLQDMGFDLAQPLKMRIGIGTGPVVVGDCGSTRKFDYTCLGDTVNLSSRLESANKFFGTSIMISQATFKSMGEGLVARLLGRVRVVGREKPLAVYELIGRDEENVALTQFVSQFEKMVRHYWAGEFDAACEVIVSLRKMPMGQGDRPLDIYTALLADKENYIDGGIIELESK